MNAREVARAFEEIAPISLGTQTDRDGRVLGFRFGDPGVEVNGIGVAWYLALEVIEQAVDRDLNFLLIHEPGIFFRSNISPWHSTMPDETNPASLRRKKLLLDHNVCVYTAHSNWDLQSEVGMQPTFAKAIGLREEVSRDQAVGVYRLADTSFGELIEMVKKATGLRFLRVWGDRKAVIRKVVLGFGGMIGVVDAIVLNGADAGIFGGLTEFDFIHAREHGKPVIESTHLVSESIGFRSVVAELRKKLPGERIEFLEVPFSYDWA